MRVIGSGLAVFLAVTAFLVYQIAGGGGEGAAVASVPPTVEAVASTATAPLLPTRQPTVALPTATNTPVPQPTATPTTVIDPTSVPVVTEIVEEATVAPVVEEYEEEFFSEEPADEYVADDTVDEPKIDDVGTGVSLAGVDENDPWAHAIQTPNGGMIGIVMAGLANVRALPAIDAEVVDELHAGWPVAIYGAVVGDDVSGTDLWYQVSGGGYVLASLIGPYIPAEPEVTYDGHWVDIDLTHHIAVAYIDDVPVNAVIVITGKEGFETPVGVHTIFARVESETLDSRTVGIPEGDPEYYYLPDVPYTQYFAAGGFAIHSNYWSDPWQYGTNSSHGCINMQNEDAAWFWWFLDLGSVVNIHY